MNVLIACEESQVVCTAFRKRGHNAFSCDIMLPSGNHPEWHILGDVLPILNGGYFTTMDGRFHHVDKWDMIIAFPPCTDLAVSGARHFEAKRNDGRQQKAIVFFHKILSADCDKICVENPVNIISGNYIKKWFPELAEEFGFPLKPTQRIQPYEFGHNVKKTTCLWLKNLPPLVPTNIVEYTDYWIAPDGSKYSKGGSLDMAHDENGKILSWNDPRTAIIRSKTYAGVAEAMASQWGGKI